MTIIFARTRWQYDSYRDLLKLVDLSGLQSCYVDEMDVFNPDHIYVTAPFNGEILEYMNEDKRKNKRADIVLWNLERPGGSGSVQQYKDSNNEHIKNGYLSRVIVSDKQLAKDTGFHYVTLGSHPMLGTPALLEEKVYDVIHLMCYSYRRGKWFDYPGKEHNSIQHNDDTISVAPSCWGDERHNALRLSRFMLSIHQDEFLYMEPLRFALAAAYALPIISEECLDYYPYVDCVKTSNDQAIANTARVVKEYLRNDAWYMQGWQLRRLMTEQLTFRACLEAQL